MLNGQLVLLQKEKETKLTILENDLLNLFAHAQVGNGVLNGQLVLLRKEMETKLAMLENQLEAERRRNKLDFSNLDDKIRSEYAKR